MSRAKPTKNLSNDALLSKLQEACLDSRRLLARLLQYLGEVEARGIHITTSYSSMFDYCVRGLGMSEGEASRRINAARLVRRFDSLIPRIESGAINLTTLTLLRRHVTKRNAEELFEEASHKRKFEVERMLAARFPVADVPSQIRKLPGPRTQKATSDASTGAGSPSKRGAPPKSVVPLSEDRYKVQFTANGKLRDKLNRAMELMRHSNPSGDLAAIVERALDLLIAELERARLGKTTRPLEKARPIQAGRISAALKRAVFERDGEQCSFVSKGGVRCTARTFLELDHIVPKARGGKETTDNLRVLCRAHNRHAADEAFGREHVEARIRARRERVKSAQASAIEHGDGPSTTSSSSKEGARRRRAS